MADTQQSEPAQQPPGTLGAMRHKPDHGEESYRGSGRLAGKKAVITGGDSVSAGRWPSRSPARAPTC